MAVVSYQIELPGEGEQYPEGVRVVKWTLANGDTGVPYRAPHYPDKSVQVSGTFGAGANVNIEGSNFVGGSEVWAVLNDPQGTPLAFTTAGGVKIEQVLENTYKIRPNCTSGDGTTALDVRLLVQTVKAR